MYPVTNMPPQLILNMFFGIRVRRLPKPGQELDSYIFEAQDDDPSIVLYGIAIK